MLLAACRTARPGDSPIDAVDNALGDSERDVCSLVTVTGSDNLKNTFLAEKHPAYRVPRDVPHLSDLIDGVVMLTKSAVGPIDKRTIIARCIVFVSPLHKLLPYCSIPKS